MTLSGTARAALLLAGGVALTASAQSVATVGYVAPSPDITFNITLTPYDGAFDPNPVSSYSNKFADCDLVAPAPELNITSTVNAGCRMVLTSPERLTVQFEGSAYYLTGSAPAGAGVDDVQLNIDGTRNIQKTNPNQSLADGLLASGSNLTWLSHKAVFTPLDDNAWGVQQITVTTGMQTQAPTFDDLTVSTVPFLTDDNQLNSWFDWSGNWTPQSELTSPLSGTTVTYSHALGSNAATVTFLVPQNTSYIVVNGTVGPDHNLVTIALSPNNENGTGFAIEKSLNASRPFRSAGYLWLIQLDPATEYNATVNTWSDITGGAQSAGLGNLNFYSALSDVVRPIVKQPHRGLSKGTIIGAAVGGAVGLLVLLAALVLCCCCYRRKKRAGPKKRQYTIRHVGSDASRTAFDSTEKFSPCPPPLAHPPPLTSPASDNSDRPILSAHPAYDYYVPGAQVSSNSLSLVSSSYSASGPLPTVYEVYNSDAEESPSSSVAYRSSHSHTRAQLSITNPDNIYVPGRARGHGYTDDQLAHAM